MFDPIVSMHNVENSLKPAISSNYFPNFYFDYPTMITVNTMVAEKDTIRGTHRPRRVNSSPDVRFPTHEPLSRRSSGPDIRFPTRKPLSRR